MGEDDHEATLSDLLDPEQEALLTKLLAKVMASGYGTLEIEVAGGKIRYFKPKFSLPAGKNGEPVEF